MKQKDTGVHGGLLEKITETAASALKTGALQPIRTQSETICDRGVPFSIRIIPGLSLKEEERKRNEEVFEKRGGRRNPFLPYEQALFVSEISPTHICLLNKFMVIDRHVLIVTRAFEDQRERLTLNDFEALWTVLLELGGLGFYNGGEAAGASQPHKHLQWVPVPLELEGPGLPFGAAVEADILRGNGNRIGVFEFEHEFICFKGRMISSPLAAAREAFSAYNTLVEKFHLQAESDKWLRPYNLLVTRDWMFLAPRRQEFCGTISVNALGYAGGLLVKNDAEFRQLKALGPLEVLNRVSVFG